MFEQARISRKITRISITIGTEIGICKRGLDQLNEQLNVQKPKSVGDIEEPIGIG